MSDLVHSTFTLISASANKGRDFTKTMVFVLAPLTEQGGVSKIKGESFDHGILCEVFDWFGAQLVFGIGICTDLECHKGRMTPGGVCLLDVLSPCLCLEGLAVLIG